MPIHVNNIIFNTVFIYICSQLHASASAKKSKTAAGIARLMRWVHPFLVNYRNCIITIPKLCLLHSNSYYFLHSLRTKRRPSATVTAAKAVTKRTIQLTSSQRMKNLKMLQVKRNTQSNVNWSVSCFNRWRNERLNSYDYDPGIYFADLSEPSKLTKENLIHALCFFIPEVTKQSGEYFPGKTLYQIIIGIQKHLQINKIHWRLVEDPDFVDVRTVLDNVMKERAAMNLGLVSRQADLITYDMEVDLWNRNFLGTDTPEKLRTTCYFYLGINFFLRSVQDHYNMRRWTPTQNSQLTFTTIQGSRCLVYQEDSVTKTHDGGLKDRNRDRKRVVLHPVSSNPDRDPITIIDKYIGLCPPLYDKPNFYLQCLKKPTPAQWYGYQVMGEKSIGKIIPDLMESAGYKGYFTGHSLRRSGTTRLAQAGVAKKIVKECTGHTSDAVDKYFVTSDAQREKVSEILAAEPSTSTGLIPSSMSKVRGDSIDVNRTVSNKAKPSVINVQTTNAQCNCKTTNIGNIVDRIVNDVSSTGKTTIKIQIEINKEWLSLELIRDVLLC